MTKRAGIFASSATGPRRVERETVFLAQKEDTHAVFRSRSFLHFVLFVLVSLTAQIPPLPSAGARPSTR